MLVCVKNEKYAFWVSLRSPWVYEARQSWATYITVLGQAKPAEPLKSKLISEFHHLPRVCPKQLCALVHLGCTRAAGTSQSYLFWYIRLHNLQLSSIFLHRKSYFGRIIVDKFYHFCNYIQVLANFDMWLLEKEI